MDSPGSPGGDIITMLISLSMDTFFTSGMTYLLQHLAMLRNEPQKLKAGLEAMINRMNTLYQQVRELSHELMPFELSETENFPKQLAEFIELREKQVRESGATLTWLLDNEEELNDLSTEKKALILAFIQEALHNAIRHSKAEQITVESWVADQQLGIRVSDNGIGLLEKAYGVGIKSMKAHAAKEGARLKTSEPLGGGTAIELVFNLNHHQA
ncbi:MAG: sensor histidine kinase [Flavobacteriales bacterium]